MSQRNEEWEVTSESVKAWFNTLPPEMVLQVSVILSEFKKLHDHIALQEEAFRAADVLALFATHSQVCIETEFVGTTQGCECGYKKAQSTYRLAKEKCRSVEPVIKASQLECRQGGPHDIGMNYFQTQQKGNT